MTTATETVYEERARHLEQLEAQTGYPMAYCQRCTVGPFFLIEERRHPELCPDCAEGKR